jgi:Family of unknown function (DUF5359)
MKGRPISPMKRFESFLWKLVIVQFIFLIMAQWLILYTPLPPYLGKIYEYEGVSKQEKTKTIETTVDR